jgi:hypothetical protein
MATSKFANNWSVLKYKLKQSHAHLSDADLDYVEGREGELLSRLQQLLGKSPLELAWLVDGLSEAPPPPAATSQPFLTGEKWRRFPMPGWDARSVAW